MDSVRTPIIQCIRRGLWLLTVLCLAAFAGAAYVTYIQVRSPSSSPCDDCLIKPLQYILNFGAPLAAVTIVGLACIAHRAGGRVWPVAGTGLISAGIIAALVVYGLRVFREFLPGHNLASLVWWF